MVPTGVARTYSTLSLHHHHYPPYHGYFHAGFMLSCWHQILTLPSEYCSGNWDSCDLGTSFHTSIVQFCSALWIVASVSCFWQTSMVSYSPSASRFTVHLKMLLCFLSFLWTFSLHLVHSVQTLENPSKSAPFEILRPAQLAPTTMLRSKSLKSAYWDARFGRLSWQCLRA